MRLPHARHRICYYASTSHHQVMRMIQHCDVRAQVFTPLAAAATVGVWAVVLQTPKEVPSLGSVPHSH